MSDYRGSGWGDGQGWWERNKDVTLWTLIGLGALIGCVFLYNGLAELTRRANIQPERPVFDLDFNTAMAQANCARHGMQMYQYVDASLVYRGRFPGQEAVVHCINRETNETIREFIPIAVISSK